MPQTLFIPMATSLRQTTDIETLERRSDTLGILMLQRTLKSLSQPN